MKTIHFPQIDSTNTYLKENYNNLENYTFVSADNQLKGKGRNNRKWESENSKNLLFSLLILDDVLINKFKEISIITAYTIVKYLESLNIENVSIKWPNDVFVNDNKICGILLETVTKDKMECLIVGVGININQIEFSNDLLIKATSLSKLTNKSFDLNSIKQELYSRLLANLDKLKEGYDFYYDITNYDYLKNKEVYINLNDKKEHVKVLGINNDFSIKVLLNNNELDLSSDEISLKII